MSTASPSTTTRYLDQEPDCIALVKSETSESADLVIVATYSLIPDAKENTRRGSLQVLPFQHDTGDTHILTRLDFPFGVYDLQIHPSHQEVLGVATSDAEILFYTVKVTDAGINFSPAGRVLVEEPAEDGRLSIITSFQFLTQSKTTQDGLEVLLVATTQFGNTKLIRTTVREGPERAVDAQILVIHQQAFDLEAWTTLVIHSTQSNITILSGGDDSQLILTCVELEEDLLSVDLDLLSPTTLQVDKKTHEAGIVSMCDSGWWNVFEDPNARAERRGGPFRVILTGSYDEKLRVFLLAEEKLGKPPRYLVPLSEFGMGGGVWRIKLLDAYSRDGHGIDFVLLVAGHTAGAFIVRLNISRAVVKGLDESQGWTCRFHVEESFIEHKSLVYAVTARESTVAGQWDIVSTSFYDKRICNWSWTDDSKPSNAHMVDVDS